MMESMGVKIFPGDRVGAIFDQTLGSIRFLGYGVYLGEEVPPESFGPFFGPNPKILLDNGDIVWGYQCWWGPESKIRKILESGKVIEVRMADIIKDRSCKD